MNRVAVMLEHHELEALERLGERGIVQGGEPASAEEVARYVLHAVIVGTQTTGSWQQCVCRALFPHVTPRSLKSGLDCTSRPGR